LLPFELEPGGARGGIEEKQGGIHRLVYLVSSSSCLWVFVVSVLGRALVMRSSRDLIDLASAEDGVSCSHPVCGKGISFRNRQWDCQFRELPNQKNLICNVDDFYYGRLGVKFAPCVLSVLGSGLLL
jgi:hypothetical protein